MVALCQINKVVTLRRLFVLYKLEVLSIARWRLCWHEHIIINCIRLYNSWQYQPCTQQRRFSYRSAFCSSSIGTHRRPTSAHTDKQWSVQSNPRVSCGGMVSSGCLLSSLDSSGIRWKILVYLVRTYSSSFLFFVSPMCPSNGNIAQPLVFTNQTF